MPKIEMRLWWEGVCCSQPIILGYLPVAIMFGIGSRTAGLTSWETVWISMTIFAGPSQFALVGMLASGVSPPSALLATIGLNLSHLLNWKHFLLIAFGLTDEVFFLSVAQLPEKNPADRYAWMFGLECGSYFAWLLGTLVGALVFQMLVNLLPALVPVLSFSLPSLFLVLLLPLLKEPAGVRPAKLQLESKNPPFCSVSGGEEMETRCS